jgi:hypothetical protein
MANHKQATGPDRLGGAQPPSSGGYGDIDRSAQKVGESDAPDVKQQEPRALEGLSGMNPAPRCAGPRSPLRASVVPRGPVARASATATLPA